MKNKLLSLISFSVLSLFLSSTTFAQVGINNIDPKARLDISATNTTSPINTDGLLIPRVDEFPSSPTANQDGMMVYLTGAGAPAEGFWYWNGSKWLNIDGGNDWNKDGNASTVAGTNFIGTTDAQELSFKTNNIERFWMSQDFQFRSTSGGTAALPNFTWKNDNNTGFYSIGADILGFTTGGSERMRILDDGRVSINNNSPFAVDLFTSTAPADDYAINGYSSGTGVGVYGENTGLGYGVWGNASNIGVYGSGGIGTYGDASGASGFGMRDRNTNATGTGLLASGTNSLATYLTSGTGIASNGVDGLFSYARTTTGTGILTVGNNNASIYNLTDGSGLAATGTEIGVFGIATTTTVDGFGGYFYNDGSYAYVGGWYNDPMLGWIAYKILGNGIVSTIVKDENENPVVMFAPEAPEVLFQDYGIGTLSNGTASIIIDPTLSKNIRVDVQHPLKVFIQLEGDCNGVYVTNKSANGFTVRELQGGTSNVDFAWSIVATRANEEFVREDGSTRISNNSVRFPNAPLPRDKKIVKTITEKTSDLKPSKKNIIN